MSVDVPWGVFWKDALPERISSRILKLIADKQLAAGDKLPSERELAAMMQVSRPSVREALRALAMMNVVEIRQGSGTYVTSLKPELLVEHLDFVFSLDTSTFVQLFEARKILEVGIAALAAERISDEALQELEAALDKCVACVDDPDMFQQVDTELHEKIIAAAGNPILSRFMASIGRLGQASRSHTTHFPGMTRQAVEDHRAIIAALRAHDPEAAYQAMLRHLIHVGKGFETIAQADQVTSALPVNSTKAA